MKLRMAHVANSSSASFILKFRSLGRSYPNARVLYKEMFDLMCINDRGAIITEWDSWEPVTKDQFLTLCEKTEINQRTQVISIEFFTSMHNSHADFGPIAHLISTHLLIDDHLWEVLSKRVVR